ncbi:MAG: cell division protein FtsA, partial [Oscillospiraceae bacterium]|nr:cell division protein FtsA [Oscillospiraceae bacterium]
MENLETIMNTDTRYNAENLIFALDIGTRSVIGVVGAMEGDKFKIVATETVEHEKRAMIDGQIEDISAVSAVAAKVKARLEARIGGSLRRVCVAAAGRALKTSLGEYSMTLSPQDAITQEKLYELEMGAVSRASETIAKTDSSMDFYCVGYSVRRY